MKIGPLLAHVGALEKHLAGELRAAAERHRDEHDVHHQCHTFAVTADKRVQKLGPVGKRYGGRPMWKTAIADGSEDVLEDMRVLYLREQEIAATWVMVSQAAKAARDQELLALATECHSETEVQAKWFMSRIKTGAPQALVVA